MNTQSSTQGAVGARLAAIRQVMNREGVDALLVPSALTGLTGVGYVAYRHAVLVRQRRAGNGPASQDAP